jgi:hypothetical protein
VGEVVNLRLVRKAKARTAKEATAAANRAAFGRTKAQKQADASDRARHDRTLDGAELDR